MAAGFGLAVAFGFGAAFGAASFGAALAAGFAFGRALAADEAVLAAGRLRTEEPLAEALGCGASSGSTIAHIAVAGDAWRRTSGMEPKWLE